ncbi:MAG: rod shape-determining protein MreC [Bacteroidales bacterium]
MRALLWLLKKYNYVLVFIVLEALALVLLSNHNSFQHSILVNMNREIAGRLNERIARGREYLHLKENNEILVRENASLRNRIELLAAARPDSVPADSMHTDYDYIPARIVQKTHDKQFNYLTINKGKKQGVQGDMAVISEEGIVGIVLASSNNFSTIIPVINRDFRLSVKTKKDNFSGILQWEGRNHRQANLNEIPYHAEPEIGDTVVTSGYSAVFPEGLFVGTIRQFELKDGNFYRIDILLGTDYQRLFHVNIIHNKLQEEQLELESAI